MTTTIVYSINFHVETLKKTVDRISILKLKNVCINKNMCVVCLWNNMIYKSMFYHYRTQRPLDSRD